MKRLILILLSSIFLGASLCSYAVEKAGHLSLGETELQTYCEGTTDFSSINDYEALISPAHLRRASINHHRLQTYTNTVSHMCFALFSKTTADPIRFYKPYVYCKPIGLKLVFPQHYFW